MENDARSPRLRLAVIGYLTESGYLPSEPAFMDTVQTIIDWVCMDTEEYASMVEALAKEEDEGFGEVRDGYEILDMKKNKDTGGYL